MKKSQIQDNFICKFYTNFQERNNILHLQKTKQTLLNSLYSIQFSSVQSLSHVWLCDPMNHSAPGLPVHHQLPEFTQTHVHWVGDAIQPSHPLSSPSPPAPNLFQHQCLYKWVSSSHQVAKVLEFQLQHQDALKKPFYFYHRVFMRNHKTNLNLEVAGNHS